MEDRTAIFRIKQGDLNGLEILVQRYQARAVQAAYLVLYDREMAEDIVQSAFVKVVERVRQFDEQRPFAPWFFRIVVNDAVKVAKRRTRNISFDQQLEYPARKLADYLMDPQHDPEQILEEKETRQSILMAIQSLVPEQRAVIVMRYFLSLSEADMSIKLERPLSTIKWWLREARKRLRDRMGSRAEGE